MPSLLISDSPDSLMNSKTPKQKKFKKIDFMDLEPEALSNGHSIYAPKSKQKKKEKKIDSDGDLATEKKKEKKRRKASDEDSSDIEEKVKKPKLLEKEDDPNAVSKFRISDPVKEKLKLKGIESLFPIQSMTFNVILDGSDLVGRARTGQGKTLAFVLPILESLTNGPFKASRKTGYGRTPSVLVLLPTRELAKQVHADFEFYGSAAGLSACSVYGGSSMREQEYALKRGVDVIIGTPGRIKDLIERNTLDLKSLKFRILDEADEMLNMGFVDDVEFILGKVEDASKVQTLLFSATLPVWVKKIAARFLKSDKKTVDLVGNEKMKASASVRHIVLPCSQAARQQVIPDIIRCYSSGGRTIIFTETKESASQLSGLLPGSRALHGDIAQAQREVVLAGFRAGRFLVLVATSVAARGLDIHDVQLIIQCQPPRNVEAYIHRSGRTGRAGNTGVAVLLYEPKYSQSILRIERESGVKFERVSAPQPSEIAESAGSEAAQAISMVSESVVPVFLPQAEELLSSSGLSVMDLLAKALAKVAGYTDIKKRSILSSMENYVTVILKAGRPIYNPSSAFGIMRRFLPQEKVDGIKNISITADGLGAVFDVPAEDLSLFLEGKEDVEVLEQLPPLQEKEQSNYGGYRGRFRGGGGGFSRGGGGGGGNRFGKRN